MDGISQELFVAVTAVVTRHRHRVGVFAFLMILVLAAVFAGLAIGSRTVPLGTVYHALTCPGGLPLSCPARGTDEQIVRTLRLPRTALALVAGPALGMAGALMQGYTRNPLADSGLLGLNAGAAFLAALGVHLFALTEPDQYIWLAFTGALVAGLVVFGISGAGGGTSSPLGLVLAGAAVTALLQALTNAVVLLDPGALDTYRFWVIGSVAGHDTSVLWQVLPFVIAGALLAVAAAPGLDALALGDDVARGLGVRIGRNRALGLIAVVLLSGAATAAVGPIAFLGLAVPHLGRMLTGPGYRLLLPCSALLGALVLLCADILGRVVARPGELEAGVVLAAIGGPVFIALVRRRKTVGL